MIGLTFVALCATAALVAAAADAPKAAAGKNLLKPANKADSWRFEQHEGGKGALAAGADAVAFDVTAVDGTDWHVQAFQVDLDLNEGKTYVVTLTAKASAERTMKFCAGIDQDDWHLIGLDEEVSLGKEWKDFKFEFKAEGVVANKNRIGLQFGNEKGKVWVKSLTLAEK